MSETPKAITSASLPEGRVAFNDPNDPYPTVQARPLQMPDFVNIKSKNPVNALRWCNRVAGEGQRLDQVTYAGFRPAKPDECYMPGRDGSQVAIPASMVKDGKILYGDLICMLIERAAYDGALKHNWERAINRMHPKAALGTGKEELNKTLKEVGVRLLRILVRS